MVLSVPFLYKTHGRNLANQHTNCCHITGYFFFCQTLNLEHTNVLSLQSIVYALPFNYSFKKIPHIPIFLLSQLQYNDREEAGCRKRLFTQSSAVPSFQSKTCGCEELRLQRERAKDEETQPRSYQGLRYWSILIQTHQHLFFPPPFQLHIFKQLLFF